MGFPVAHSGNLPVVRRAQTSNPASSRSSSSESADDTMPWYTNPANLQADRVALLGGRFDIGEILDCENTVAQYLCGGEPEDMDEFTEWCKENGALRLCIQAALDYPEQTVHIDIGDTEWLDAFHNFDAPHGLRIFATPESFVPSDEEQGACSSGPGAAPAGLPMDRPDAAVQLALKYLETGKVTSVSIKLRADPPVPPEVWKAMEDGLRGARHLQEVLLDVDLDDDLPSGPLLGAIAENPSPEMHKVTLNLRNLPESRDEDVLAMTALLHKPGLARIEIESGGDTLHGLVQYALRGKPLEEAKTLVFQKYSPYAILGCLNCIQPRLSVVSFVPGGGIQPIRETILRKIAKGPGSLAQLQLVHGAHWFDRDTAGLRDANKEISEALRRTSTAFTNEAGSVKFSGEWAPRTLEAFFRSADVPYSAENAAVLASIISEEGYLEPAHIHGLAVTGSGAAKGAESGSIASLEGWMKAKREQGEHPSRIESGVHAVLAHGTPDAHGPKPAIKGSLFDVHRTVTAGDLDDVLLDLRASKNAGAVSLSIGELVPGMADALVAALANMPSLALLTVDFKPGPDAGEIAVFLGKLGALTSGTQLPSIRINGVEMTRGMTLENLDEESLNGLALLLGGDESVADSTLALMATMDMALTPEAAESLAAKLDSGTQSARAAIWRLPVRGR